MGDQGVDGTHTPHMRQGPDLEQDPNRLMNTLSLGNSIVCCQALTRFKNRLILETASSITCC